MLYVHARVTYLMCMCACMCIYMCMHMHMCMSHVRMHMHMCMHMYHVGNACLHVYLCTQIKYACTGRVYFYYYLLITANMPLIWGPLLSFLM